MKRRIIFYTMFFTIVLLCGHAVAQDAKPVKTNRIHHWWKEDFLLTPYNSPDAKKLSMISVKGNKFVNANSDTILFRGLATSDPDKLEEQGHWNKNYFSKIKEMGATIVRIPVHPISWRERTPEGCLKLLDQAIGWCTELGMYVMIDWHCIGNLETELFQNPIYITTKKETSEFWSTIAGRYSGHNTVAFYELFNEPTSIDGQLGRVSWDDWKKINEELIELIRAYDKKTIPLVAGFDWAYDLSPIRVSPIDAPGIGYVTHPYSHKRSKPWELKWEEDFGFATWRYPVFATEFGFIKDGGGFKENGEYGQAIIKYLEDKGISWAVWVFDAEWYPPLITSWDTFKLSESGQFFKKAMQDTTRIKH